MMGSMGSMGLLASFGFDGFYWFYDDESKCIDFADIMDSIVFVLYTLQ